MLTIPVGAAARGPADPGRCPDHQRDQVRAGGLRGQHLHVQAHGGAPALELHRRGQVPGRQSAAPGQGQLRAAPPRDTALGRAEELEQWGRCGLAGCLRGVQGQAVQDAPR